MISSPGKANDARSAGPGDRIHPSDPAQGDGGVRRGRAARSIGLVVVHGVGRQKPGETVDMLRQAFIALPAVGSRHGTLAGRRPAPEAAASAADPEARLVLDIDAPGGGVSIRLYEAYWADLSTSRSYGRRDAVRYRLWLLWTLVYPVRNFFGHRYRPVPVAPLAFLRWFLELAATGVAAHLTDLALRAALGLVGRGREIDRVLLDYGGDVFRYVSGNRAPFLARFREAFARAAAENAEVQILGHSLGSVIAYDALTAGILRPEEAAKLSALHTWGSPLDKFYFVWPHRLRFELAPLPPHPPRWVNWHRRFDPFGGRLDFFGSVHGLRAPENLRAKGPGWFAAAHTDYWTNPRVIGSLLEALGIGGRSAPGAG
jgi:hypothetical protein